MRGKSQRRLLALVALASVLAISAGCEKKGGETTEAGFNLIEKGKLTVCTGLPYAPFQFEDPPGSQKIVGFDVELIDIVAQQNKLEQKIVDTPFEGIQSGQDLNTGRCDLVAAAMTIKPDRQAVMDVSDPYFDADQAMMVLAGKPYKTLADLAGRKVGVQAETTGADYVTEQLKKEGLEGKVQVVSFEDLGTEESALKTGQVDAAVNDFPVFGYARTKNPGTYEIATKFQTNEQYGFWVQKKDDANNRKGNEKLVAALNKMIKDTKADGRYAQLYKKWMGEDYVPS